MKKSEPHKKTEKSAASPLWERLGWGGGPGVYYLVVCLASLALIFLVLAEKQAGSWSLLPIGVGLIGLLTRWSSAPAMLLLAVTVCLNVPVRFGRLASPFMDVLLCAATLAFVVAQYRLQCVQGYIFPADQRRQDGQKSQGLFSRWRHNEGTRQRRAESLVTPGEIGLLALSLPIWALLGMMVWGWLPLNYNIGFLPWVWRAMVFAWAMGVALLVAAGFFDYWRQRHFTSLEATVYLQDMFWHETRREQRRLNRWGAWFRLRRQRRRERW